ncbi:hypothetical protein BD309DRAFT_945296 [Dichomitus squalens]|nr:hypothetical protein BD309DRAFT_945296 [Dichomitus squalens]
MFSCFLWSTYRRPYHLPTMQTLLSCLSVCPLLRPQDIKLGLGLPSKLSSIDSWEHGESQLCIWLGRDSRRWTRPFLALTPSESRIIPSA